MGIIIFTRTEHYGVVTRRYGEFSFIVAMKGISCQGRMTSVSRITGDEEIKVMIHELAECWREYRELTKDKPKLTEPLDWPVKKGAGVVDGIGPFRAVKAPGLVIKMTEKRTEIVCTDLLVSSAAHAKAFAQVLQDAIGERDELRMDIRNYKHNRQEGR